MDDLNWKGDEVSARMRRAQIIGVNQTMAMCVVDGKQNHGFTNRTGTAERSITIAAAARELEGIVFGMWGSVQVVYFKWLERGTAAMFDRRATQTKARKTTKAPAWKGGFWRPTLRMSAEKIYPQLIPQIAMAWKRLG